MANTTSSVTVSDLVTLQHLRRLHCVRSSRMEADIRLTSLLLQRLLQRDGGQAEDLQGPAVFLASDASDFVNGHVVYVDGGILAYIGKQP